MSDGLLFVVLSLGVFRIWRFLGRDDITAPLRERLPSFILKGVSCPWCLGSWIAIAATYGIHSNFQLLRPNWPLWAAGVAAVVGFLGEIDARLADD